MTVEEWLASIAPGIPNTLVASAIGKTPSTVTRWKNGDIPVSAEDVIALARYFKAPVLESLVNTGFLNKEEASKKVTDITFREITNEAMLEELMRRSMSARYRLELLHQRSKAMMQESPDSEAANFASVVMENLSGIKTNAIGRKEGEPF
nr:helix-turn-helix transcriptional regulator [Rhodococcus sp. (in: high G+C Gram-positive bacteria)]